MIATEVLKLRTVRSTWLLMAAALLLTLSGVIGIATSDEDMALPKTWTAAIGHVGLASLFTLVLGIMAIAGEYRHKTITETFLTTPERGRLVLAKLVVCTAAGVVVGVLSSVAALLVTAAAVAADGSTFAWSNGEVWRTIGGGIAWNAAFAAIGVGIGALARNLAGALAAALAWLALVEGVVAGLVGDGIARWLPMASGRALGNTGDATGSELLPQLGAGALLACYAIAFATLAFSITLRRDVS